MLKIPTQFGDFPVCWRDGKLFYLGFPDEQRLPELDCEAPGFRHDLLAKWLQQYCVGGDGAVSLGNRN